MPAFRPTLERMKNDHPRARIIIAGGGIAGITAARELDRLIRHRSDIEVLLVNRDNFFLLSPLLFEACSGVLELRHCAAPIRPSISRVRFMEGAIQRIDVERRVVHVVGPSGAKIPLEYDHLIVALGATTNTKVIPGSEHAWTFKTVADALLLRNHLIELLERADVEPDADRRRELLTVVVVGGGLVGVELLGELTAFFDSELRYYPRLRRRELRFHVFEIGNRLLPESTRFLGGYAERVLRERGAEIHTSTAVTAIEPGVVKWSEGAVCAETIVLVPGIVPNVVASETAVERDKRGRIVTETTLRSVSHSTVWAIGDCAAIPGPDGKPYPALAQHAVREARAVARNVAATISGRAPKPFVFDALGSMAAFGRTRAAVDLRGLHFTGFIAWFIRRTYYLFQMPRWERRLRIALDWTVSLICRPDLTKIDPASEREQDRSRCAAGSVTSCSGVVRLSLAEPLGPVIQTASAAGEADALGA